MNNLVDGAAMADGTSGHQSSLQLHCRYPCFAVLPFVVHVALIAAAQGEHQSGQNADTCWGIEDTIAEATGLGLDAQIMKVKDL
jgi:hypothetical protein